MKFILNVLLVLIIFFCNLTYAQASLVKDGSYQNLSYKKYLFDNGLTVILAPLPTNTVIVDVNYNFGSQVDPVGLEGLAHLTEHLLFHKPDHFGEINYYRHFAEQLGDSLRGATSDVFTYYNHKHVPRHYLERMLWLEAQRMGHMGSAINNTNVEHEKAIVVREILESQERKGATYQRTSMSFGKEFHRVAGTPESVERIAVEDIQQFYRAYYRPNNAVLLIAGDFDEELALQWVDQYFSPIKPYEFPRPLSIVADNTNQQLNESRYAKYVTPELDPEFNVLYLFPPVSGGSTDYLVMDLLSESFVDIIKDNGWEGFDDVETYVSLGGVDLYRPRLEFVYFPDYNESLSVSASRHQQLLDKLSELHTEDIEPAILATKVHFNNSNIWDQQYWRKRAYALSINEAENGDPARDLYDPELYADISAKDVIDGIQRFIINQPAIYQSVVDKEELAYKPANQPWYVPAQRAEAISALGNDIPLKINHDRLIMPLPEIKDVSDTVAHVPTVWEDFLENEIRILGITQPQVGMTSAKLLIGNVPIGHDPKRDVAIAKLAEALINKKIELLLDEEQQVVADADMGISRRNENIILSVSSISEYSTSTLQSALSILTVSESDELLFNDLKESLAEDSPNISLRDIVAKLFFSKDKGYYALANRDYYEIYDTIEWSEVSEFIEDHITDQLNGLIVVSDLSQAKIVEMLNAVVVNGKTHLEHSPFRSMPGTPTVSLKKGIHIIFDKGGNVDMTVVSSLPNINSDARYMLYTRVLVNIYQKYFVFNVLREELGLAYSPVAKFFWAEKFVQLWTSVQTTHEDAVTALSRVHGFYKQFTSRKAITSEMLEIKRAGLQARPQYDFYRHDDSLDYLMRVYSYPSGDEYMQDWLDALNDMTVDSINDWAATYMDPDELIMIVDNTTEQEVPAIREFAASIDYPLYFYERSDETSELTLIEAMSPSTE